MIARLILFTGLALGACSFSAAGPLGGEVPQAAEPVKKGQAEAIFAAGCFWCSEKDFEKLEGVIEVESGYAGGSTKNPTYYQVGSGATGHTEAIRVIYDPDKITYEDLLTWYWHHVDPFDGSGQFCDRGSQYRPAILPLDDAQRKAAAESKARIQQLLGKEVAVDLEAPGTFWVAEGYHQDFYKKKPAHYSRYRTGCGRDARVRAIWKGVTDPAYPPEQAP
jgi:peptide-methionine (S)-S-oxide reductase